MTIEEVKRLIDTGVENEGGAVIECKNICQRTEAIQFLLDIGYELGSATEDWLRNHPNDTTFLHPGLNSSRKVTCWKFPKSMPIIRFEEIIELIVQNDSSIDERSDREFLDALSVLMS